MIKVLIIFLATYLIGAIPTGYWVGLTFGVNVLEEGSKSTGATNVLRLVGKWQAALTVGVDILKGFIPIFIFKNYIFTDFSFESFADSSTHAWLTLALSLVPILAHSKSIYIAFKGGKSSATGFGVLLALNWIVGLITIAIWISSVKISRISSMGSIVCVPLVPVWLWLFKEELPIILFGIVAFIYIVLIKHKANIQRLLNGTEPRIGENK